MFLEANWIFFHCIRKNRTQPYLCRQVDNILEIKIPKIESDEILVPLCGYIPHVYREYYLKKHIWKQCKLKILNTPPPLV